MERLEEPMKKLAVTTCTTVEELALFINSLPSDSILGGNSGADGMVVLYALDCDAAGSGGVPLRDRVAARVAVEVSLQQIAGMPGTAALLRNVEEQFQGDHGVRAGWLSPPLTILARIYKKTVNALPAPIPPGTGRHYFTACHEDADPFPPKLNPEQRQAVESLIDKLLLLAKPGKIHGKA